MSGWSTLVIGLLALPFSLGSGATLALAIVLIGTGWHELTLRGRLGRLDPTAPRWLAINQCILGGAIIAYAISMLLAGPPTLDTLGGSLGAADPTGALMQEPQFARTFDQAETIAALAHALLYGGLIAGTLLFQGGGAVMYIIRGFALRRFLREAPPWIADLRRRGLLA